MPFRNYFADVVPLSASGEPVAGEPFVLAISAASREYAREVAKLAMAGHSACGSYELQTGRDPTKRRTVATAFWKGKQPLEGQSYRVSLRR